MVYQHYEVINHYKCDFFTFMSLSSQNFKIHMAQLFKVIRDSEIKLSGTVVSNNCANNRQFCLVKKILRHFVNDSKVFKN